MWRIKNIVKSVKSMLHLSPQGRRQLPPSQSFPVKALKPPARKQRNKVSLHSTVTQHPLTSSCLIHHFPSSENIFSRKLADCPLLLLESLYCTRKSQHNFLGPFSPSPWPLELNNTLFCYCSHMYTLSSHVKWEELVTSWFCSFTQFSTSL